jgi:hypothetical protein
MGVAARQTKIGINIATAASWASTAAATAVGAGDGHYLRDDVAIQSKPMVSREDVATQPFIGMTQVGNLEAIQAQLPMYLHYHDVFQNVLFALALGTGGTSPTALGGLGFSNTFEPATSRTTLWGTIVRDKVVYISEVPGAVFTGFEIRVGDGGRMEVDWLFVGNDETEGSTTNTSTQINALTFPTQGRRWFFKDAVIRLNSQSGGAIGASDAVLFSNFKLRVEQPVDVKYAGGQQTIIRPLDNGFPKITLDLTFARFDSTSQAFFTAMKANTKYKADIVFTGPTIDATSTYGLKFQFPHLSVMTKASPLPNTAQSEPKVMLEANSTSAAPTGMTGVTAPVRVTTTGISNSNPFA